MKKLAILLLALLMLSQASALEIFDPRSAGYLEAEYSEFGNISVATKDGTMPYLKLNLYSFPRESETLRVYSMDTDPNAVFAEKDGEPAYLFEWKNLQQGVYDYRLDAFVKSSQFFPKINKKIEFPFSVPDEIKQFTQATRKTESDDLEIKQTANKIIAGETDAYKIAFKLAEWVHEHTTYDEAYWKDVYSAKSVLESGRGVCDEFSNLFIALARSVGLPARYVVGSVYTNIPTINDFQYHAWAEVWLPDFGWVPFDPTFAEYGWIDPTHIKVRDSKIVEPTSISYAWQKGDVIASSLNSDVKIITKRDDLPEYIKTESWLQEDKINFGSHDILWLQLENTQDFYIHTAAWLSKAPDIDGKNQADLLLGPKEKTTIGWIINVPADLDEHYTYTYQIESSALFSANSSAKLEVVPKDAAYISLAEARNKIDELAVAKKNSGQPKISVTFEFPSETFVNTQATITAKIKNSGTAPNEKFKVCMDDNCKNIYVGINDNVEQNFTLIETAPGIYKHILKFSDNTQEIEISVKNKTFVMLLLDFLRALFGSQRAE